MVILDMTKGLNHIGRLGENEHRTFRFPDSCEVLAMYPEATVSVLVKRPGDSVAYPVTPGFVEIRNGAVYWTVRSADLARIGRGNVELTFVDGTTVAKNIIYDVYVDKALDGAGDPPEPWESWQTDITAIAGEIARDRAAAEQAAEDAIEAQGKAEAAQEAAESAERAAGESAGAADTSARAAAESAGAADRSAGVADQSAQAAGRFATAADQSAQAAAGSVTAAGEQAGAAAGSARDAAASALEAERITFGTENGTPVPSTSPYSENNAKYLAGLTAEDRTAAENAKTAIQNMGVSAQTLQPGSQATVTKNVDQQTGAISLQYGIPSGADGVTFTPAVSADGVLSWSNDQSLPNPAAVDIAGAVRGVIDETVTGTTPTIVGTANHRYLCGEVATISITPPAQGIIDVIFTSGSTAAVLTLPSTVRMPEWFDTTALDTDTIYEINICDGIYGVVTLWPAT